MQKCRGENNRDDRGGDEALEQEDDESRGCGGGAAEAHGLHASAKFLFFFFDDTLDELGDGVEETQSEKKRHEGTGGSEESGDAIIGEWHRSDGDRCSFGREQVVRGRCIWNGVEEKSGESFSNSFFEREESREKEEVVVGLDAAVVQVLAGTDGPSRRRAIEVKLDGETLFCGRRSRIAKLVDADDGPCRTFELSGADSWSELVDAVVHSHVGEVLEEGRRSVEFSDEAIGRGFLGGGTGGDVDVPRDGESEAKFRTTEEIRRVERLDEASGPLREKHFVHGWDRRDLDDVHQFA